MKVAKIAAPRKRPAGATTSARRSTPQQKRGKQAAKTLPRSTPAKAATPPSPTRGAQALVNALAALLLAHEARPAGAAVAAALEAVHALLTMIERYLDNPGALRLAVEGDRIELQPAAPSVATAPAAAPSSGSSSASALAAPSAPALGRIHHALAAAAAEGIEALVSATEAAQWVEASASQLDGYAGSSLPDALLVMRSQHDDLRQTLATISRHLTGERWPASLAAHAIALDRLLAQLAEPEVGHDEAQAARERAARAWTGTD